MKKIPFISLLSVFVLTLAIFLSKIPSADAAYLSGLSDTMSAVKISTSSSHTIRMTTPTGASDNTDTIIVTFPSDFNFTSKTIGTVTFTHGATTGAESTETLAASPSGTAWGAVFSGTQNRILTLTAPTDGVGAATLAAADKIILTYSSSNSTNASVAGSYQTGITGTFGDVGTTTVTIVNDDTVAVSGTVNQSLSFAISANTIAFGTLDSAAARYANTTTGSASDVTAHTLAVSTNGPTGYTITVQGATLTSQQSSANTITAIGSTAAASSAGTEQFGLYATKSGGANGTIDATYATASSFGYDGTVSTAATFASGTSATATETYSLHYLANIAATTEAGTYAASLVYVATANF